jgi:hypothetical protein
LALAEVESPKNGLIPTAISTISALYTSASAKNLKIRSQSSKVSGKTQNFPNKSQHIFTLNRQEPLTYHGSPMQRAQPLLTQHHTQGHH